jgi:hypothetical protein
MGTRRYSNLPSVRKREEQFDRLQWRCDADHYTPTVGELLDAGIENAKPRCSFSDCLHTGDEFSLSKIDRDMTVARLRRRFFCTQCLRRKVKLQLIFAG